MDQQNPTSCNSGGRAASGGSVCIMGSNFQILTLNLRTGSVMNKPLQSHNESKSCLRHNLSRYHGAQGSLSFIRKTKRNAPCCINLSRKMCQNLNMGSAKFGASFLSSSLPVLNLSFVCSKVTSCGFTQPAVPRAPVNW